MKKLGSVIAQVLKSEPAREIVSLKELESELVREIASVKELKSELVREVASVKELKFELVREIGSVKELYKKNRTAFWTSILLALFSLCVAIGNSYLVVDLTEKNSEIQENRTVLSLLNNAKVDAYIARTLIHGTEELYKSKNNNHSLVDMANRWNKFGARLPYPEALAMALDEKSVRIKLSQAGSISFYDYKEQLANDRNLIMNPNIDPNIKSDIYESYKHDLQDLTSLLQEEIRFQNNEINEEEIAGFYIILKNKKIKREEENIKMREKMINDFEMNSAQ